MLSYTFPFYYGCTNLSDYYLSGSYEYIDIADLGVSISVIEKILQDSNYYQKHFSSLNEVRMKHLMTYQVLSLMTAIINSIDKENKSNAKDMVLQPPKFRIWDLIFKAKFLFIKLKRKYLLISYVIIIFQISLFCCFGEYNQEIGTGALLESSGIRSYPVQPLRSFLEYNWYSLPPT